MDSGNIFIAQQLLNHQQYIFYFKKRTKHEIFITWHFSMPWSMLNDHKKFPQVSTEFPIFISTKNERYTLKPKHMYIC